MIQKHTVGLFCFFFISGKQDGSEERKKGAERAARGLVWLLLPPPTRATFLHNIEEEVGREG